MHASENMSLATFGGGCFWCTQAVFQQLRGVHRVTCGYSGGNVDDPTYEDVCSGATGHAEVVQIQFDPAVISYNDLLQVFFQTHDPTTLNRQGNDIGTQYRSVVFWSNQQQRDAATRTIGQLESNAAFDGRIVTQVVPLDTFYAAEPCHQDYFAAHPTQSYCAAVIRPKIDKFRTKYADLLKNDENDS